MLRRVLTFVLAFVAGYRAAYVVVDTVGRTAIGIPWRESPRLLATGVSGALRARIADPVVERVEGVRSAVEDGRRAKRERERELRADLRLGLPRRSTSEPVG